MDCRHRRSLDGIVSQVVECYTRRPLKGHKTASCHDLAGKILRSRAGPTLPGGHNLGAAQHRHAGVVIRDTVAAASVHESHIAGIMVHYNFACHVARLSILMQFARAGARTAGQLHTREVIEVGYPL